MENSPKGTNRIPGFYEEPVESEQAIRQEFLDIEVSSEGDAEDATDAGYDSGPH